MKKLLSVLSLCVLGLVLSACSSDTYEVALVTDSGTINDGSFNESAWNGIKEYCAENDISYKYYQPTADTNDERWLSVQLAVRSGAKIVVLPGYLFETIICDASETYEDVKFLLLDGSYKNDNEFNVTYDSTKTYDNVYCVSYQEEQAGFLAGYAAVKDGYTKLGFFGGMALPAVIKFGYGFLQGAEAAAVELDITVSVNYTYAGQFYADAATDLQMATWAADGVEVIFACGGGIWESVGKAAATTDVKMIGVDVDQYSVGTYVITSATKGLKDTVITTLGLLFEEKWDTVGGDIDTLGLGSSSSDVQYVGLPMDTARFETFTETEYNSVVTKLQNKTITVNNTVVESTNLVSLLGLTKVSVTLQ